MGTVQEVKSAIAKLSLEERAELISELCGLADDDWERHHGRHYRQTSGLSRLRTG